MEKQSRKIISLPVFSVCEGEQIGFVKSVVVDPGKKEIIALVIDQKGWFRENKIIPFNRVSSIGVNAITVDKAVTAEKPTNLPQILKLVKDPVALIGSRVVTAAGKTIGFVEEYWFNMQGQITRLEISGGLLNGLFKGKVTLPANEMVTVGKDVIIAMDGAENRLTVGGNNLQHTVEDLKQATSKAWDNTLTGSQRLGKALKQSIGKLVEEEKKIKEKEIPPETENKDEDTEENSPESLQEPNIKETRTVSEPKSEPKEEPVVKE